MIAKRTIGEVCIAIVKSTGVGRVSILEAEALTQEYREHPDFKAFQAFCAKARNISYVDNEPLWRCYMAGLFQGSKPDGLLELMTQDYVEKRDGR